MLSAFHPLVQRWFAQTLGEPSEPQRAGWPAIASGSHTLILAPTGTGKTLAAFLYELDALIREGETAPLANAVHLLYISPLKALSNDIQRNLEGPLAELASAFRAEGKAFPEIRVAVRTGDTSASARARMIRKTPQILITTPESLHLLMMSAGGRSMFSSLRAVIVDEIHAVAGTKRGAHLALTLERLDAVSPAPPQRIGLSATQRPLDEVARFLGGCDIDPATSAPQFRAVTIVDCGLVKKMSTSVQSPVPDLAHVDGTIWPAVIETTLEQIRSARTTLVFVNNRGQAERVAARVNALAGEEMALPYHGSLSRERRFLLEEQLKAGGLRALVTTSSLELGIDVGSVDLVVQLQSPKRVSAALQRVGRAGHRLNAVSRGVFLPMFRDDALEQLVIVSAMQRGDVEPTRVVQNALDVLAQLLVAMVAADDTTWRADDLYTFVRQAYPYHLLPRNAFDETLAMLAGRYPSDLAAELEARLHWDRVSDVLTPARSARMVATISGGTIPDRGLYTVFLGDKTRLGELDEEFVHESRIGDVFLLGSSTWRISAIEHDRVVVVPAPGAPARMPFWHGDFMARAYALAADVGALRRSLQGADSPVATEALAAAYHSDTPTITALAEYVRTQGEITGVVPDERQLVLEQFRDDVGSVRLVLHAPFGGRVNAPWGMVLGRLMRERLGVDVQVQTTDDAIMMRLPNLGADAPTDFIRTLTFEDARAMVIEEVSNSSLFGARFRMNAARALLLPRGNPKRRMPLWLQRLKAADLLQTVRAFPAFPLLVESFREVLQDAFDMDGLRDVLSGVSSGAIGIHAVRTSSPSPFAQSMQLGFVMDWMYGDDAPRAESRLAMLSLDRNLLDELLGGEGADAATVAMLEAVLDERRGTAPDRQARNADDLAVLIDRAGDLAVDELQRRVAAPELLLGQDPVQGLLDARRLVAVHIAGKQRYLLTDALPRYLAAFGEELSTSIRGGRTLDIVELPQWATHVVLTPEAARREIAARFVSLASPFTTAELASRYDFDAAWLTALLEEWLEQGRLARGTFGGDRAVVRWCSRRALERARRRELAAARALVEPVTVDAFAAFLQRWQHVAPGTQLSGGDAAITALNQLFGLARPGLLWDREYLPSRLTTPDANALESAVTEHRVVWSVVPSKVPTASPQVRFFPRGSGALWVAPLPDELVLSDNANRVVDALRSDGASFTDDLIVSTGLAVNRLRDSLRELVVTGMITNDSIAGMRDALRWQEMLPRARADDPDPTRWLPDSFVVQRRVNVRKLARWKRPELSEPATWSGRWSLLHISGVMGPPITDESAAASVIARQWLERYGVVSRDWWRRERPQTGWRAIYRELKRLEFTGEVQRGYFVAGLAGAQFALPNAVDLLRTSAGTEPVAIAASDPANIHGVALQGEDRRGMLPRPRSGNAILVTSAGRVVLTSEGGGKRVRVADDADATMLRRAIAALIEKCSRPRGRRSRDIVLETINGELASTSSLRQGFIDAGFREQTNGLRYYL